VRSTKLATKKYNAAAAAYVKKTSEEKEEEWNWGCLRVIF
jgi:hypothetical protein